MLSGSMSDRSWAEASQKLRASAPYRALVQQLGDVVRLPVSAAVWVAELLAEDLGRPFINDRDRRDLRRAEVERTIPLRQVQQLPFPGVNGRRKATVSGHGRRTRGMSGRRIRGWCHPAKIKAPESGVTRVL